MQIPLRLGTRGSKLALAQAHDVAARLRAAHGFGEEGVEIVVIKTTGDRVQDRPLAEIGGKGLFTKEIEEALADARIDLAVHSMKDMPSVLPPGLTIDCVLEREDPRDAFVSPAAAALADLATGARVGTSSLRRAAQLRALRPDLDIRPFRGNVDTRLAKLAEGIVDATILAMAGLKRLGLGDRVTSPIGIAEMLPAVAQGVIGIERRADDQAMAAALAPLNHTATAIRLAAERAFLKILDGSCQTPIAGLADLDGDQLHFRGMVLRPDGSEVLETVCDGPASEADRLGREAGADLKERAGPGFFAEP